MDYKSKGLKLKSLSLSIALAGLVLSGCATTSPGPMNSNLILRSDIEVAPGYTLAAGEYELKKSTATRDFYSTDNVRGHNSSALSVETYWYSEDKTQLCVNTFKHQYCVDVIGISRKDSRQ